MSFHSWQNNEFLLEKHQSHRVRSRLLLVANVTFVQTYRSRCRCGYQHWHGQGWTQDHGFDRLNFYQRDGYSYSQNKKNNSNHLKEIIQMQHRKEKGNKITKHLYLVRINAKVAIYI